MIKIGLRRLKLDPEQTQATHIKVGNPSSSGWERDYKLAWEGGGL